VLTLSYSKSTSDPRLKLQLTTQHHILRKDDIKEVTIKHSLNCVAWNCNSKTIKGDSRGQGTLSVTRNDAAKLN